MNALAYEEFNKNKNGDRATQIKKSLEKLKTIVNTEPVAMNKLKILINYKYKKGFWLWDNSVISNWLPILKYKIKPMST